MKKNKIFITGLTFISGALFGISIIAVYSFASPSQSPTKETPISVDSANYYFKQYFTQAETLNKDTIKGFAVNIEQLNTLTSILKTYPDLSGFRIYLGKDTKQNDLRIVVGIDQKGVDVVTAGSIYRTISAGSGPCPKMCDASSPVIQP